MSTVWLFPIEPLEERYSAQWLRWWPAELERLGLSVRPVEGEQECDHISSGQFLDIYDTHQYKATQLARFARALHDGEVGSGDIVLLLDAWSPAVASLAYMRDAGPHKFLLCGLLHAGTWDEHDFLSKCGMERWAADVERGWFTAIDKIFVATKFHKNLLCNAGRAPRDKVYVTGFPLYTGEFERYRCRDREPLVVFPHRLASEKQPEKFDVLRALYEQRYGTAVKWVRTKDTCPTKDEYYQLLGRARVSVSTALQETWGIAMLESVALGCWPVAPDTLSYPETLRQFQRYQTDEEAVALIHKGLISSTLPVFDQARWEGSIARIANWMVS